MFHKIFSSAVVFAAVLISFTFAAVQMVSAATPVPAITYKAAPAPEKKAQGINEQISETFYPTYIRSPKSVTAAGEWRAYVARVKFTLTEDNAVVRVHAGTTVLQANPAGVKITGGITVFNPDQNAINVDAQGNVTFGTAEGGVDRQGAKQVFTIPVAAKGEHHIDIMFLDCDQNIPNGQPATQVSAAVEYIGDKVPGSEFTIAWDKGWDTETKSAAVADKKWAVLKLKEMGLGGGSTIKDDETGTPYVSPHWTRTLNVPNSPYPYLYSAASSDTLTIIKAVWEIAEAGDIDPITAETAISVTAACKDKNGTAITFDTASGSVEGNLLRFTASVAAASPFSSLTRYLNPLDLTLQMRFTAGNQDARYEDAGSTMNPVYVCLGGIFEQLEPFLYRVVVHTACADDLKTASEDAFLAAWGIVSSKQVAGWNTATSSFSRPLYYYKWDVARVDTPLTSFAEFMKKGNGRCGLWADFLWSVAALNGKILEGTSATSNLNFRNTSEPAFLVKDWIFDNPPRQPDEWHIQLASQSGFDMYPPPNNNYQYDEARSLGTLPGQNSGNRSPSEKIFGDHAFAKSVDGNTAGMYFDPSYGSIYQNAVQFQNAAIDAFCPFPANNSTTAVKQMAQHIQFGTYSFPSVPNHSSEKTENILPSRLYPTIGMSLGGLPLKPEIILPRQQSALTKKYPLNKQIVRGGQWLPFRNVNVFNVAEGNVHECDSYKVSYKITEAASPEKTLTSDWILVHNKTTDALYVGKLWKAEAPETPNSARFIENKGEIYKIFLEAGELHARHAGIHLSKSKVLFADLQAGKTKFVLNDATAESIDKILLPKIQAESVNVFAAKDVDNIVYLRELFSINFSMRYAEKFGLGEISSDVKDCLDINGNSMGRGHLRLDIINLADKQVCGRAWFDLTEKPREMNIYDGKEIVRQKVPFYLNPIHRSPLK